MHGADMNAFGRGDRHHLSTLIALKAADAMREIFKKSRGNAHEPSSVQDWLRSRFVLTNRSHLAIAPTITSTRECLCTCKSRVGRHTRVSRRGSHGSRR